MSDKICKECGSTHRPHKFVNGLCNKCYERSRRQSIPLQNLVCIQCGPTQTKKLTGGLCSRCYAREYKKVNRSLGTCPKCGKNKVLLNGNGCDGCRIAQWRKDNPGANCHYTSVRRANKKRATPKWANVSKIKQIYMACPFDFEVDHIIPLSNDLVCGLHVEHNLQYLSKSDNARKNNSFDGTQENLGWR